MSSQYCYPGTTVLINHFDIRDQEELHHVERIHTARRALEMRFDPIKGNFDLEHLQAIHRHLFQDVYPFAGEIRTVNIGKNNHWFCEKNMISRLADTVFSELKNDRVLKGLSEDAFASKAAYYYTEVNYMHPFREGNGRSIREFFSQMAREANHELHWQNVSKEEYFAAVKKTDDPKNLKDLEDVFKRCLQPDRDLIQQWMIPTEEMTLKDLLKKVEGMPAMKARLSPKQLNSVVERFSVESKTNLRVQLRGDAHSRDIPMERHPHLSAKVKSEMLDAAASPNPVQQINRYYEQ